MTIFSQWEGNPRIMSRLRGTVTEAMGFLPEIILPGDPRPVRDQIADRYSHGGGWQPFDGFTLLSDGKIQYPGDPPYEWIARTHVRDETVTMYEHAWVMVTQADGTWQLTRMD